MIRRATINDVDEVTSIMKDPDVWPHICDDRHVDRDTFSACDFLENEEVYALLDTDVVFLVWPFNHVAYEVHAHTRKRARGQNAKDRFREVVDYMFDNTRCEKLVSFVPTLYPNVIIWGVFIGWKKEGRLIKAYKKNGQLYDLIIFGICKEN